MSANNKVVWSEGMFLRPQHFQQQDRYFERYFEKRLADEYRWGFKELSIELPLLSLGKVAISRCQGIFPDGTPFSVPDDEEQPLPLEVPENTHNQIVYLAIPLRRVGAQEVMLQEQSQGLARYNAQAYDAHDGASDIGDTTQVQVGKLRLRLLLESEDRSGYACLGVARISEINENKEIKLDESFLPPVVDIRVLSPISAFVNELVGLIRHRAEEIAGRLGEGGAQGTAQITDYLLLQVLNRFEPTVVHFSRLQGLHPEALFNALIAMAGELCTFSQRSRRVVDFPPYVHEQLLQTFQPVISVLRQCLSMVREQTAIGLPLVERAYGIRVSAITDRTLLDGAVHVLAVKADMPSEALRNRFPAQVKIGPVEKIRQLVNVALPGIALQPLPVAPRQIPFHTGMTYFELDPGSDFWREMKNSGGFAVHIGGDFPGLEMEFWAIRR